MYDVVIIGSGLGGLLSGFILSKEGMKVCILERHHQPGGCLRKFDRFGCTFDTGIHYIGGMDEGQNLYRYFKYFGLTGKLKLQRLNANGFDIIGLEGKDYPLASGHENFVEMLAQYFPGSRKELKGFSDGIRRVCEAFPLYNLEVPGKEDREQQYFSSSAYGFIESHISDPALRKIIAGNNFLYAGDRDTTPSHIFSLILNSFIQSAWRLEGGSSQVVDLLDKAMEAFQGEIRTNSNVTRLEFPSGDRAVIQLQNGEKIEAKKVVSTIHPAHTSRLVTGSSLRKTYRDRLQNLRNTTGCFSVYAALKKDVFPCLDHNYYGYTSNDVWIAGEESQWPNGYLLYTPASVDRSDYAKSLVLLSFMPFEMVSAWENTGVGNRGSDYLSFKQQKAEKLLILAERKFPGLRGMISAYNVSTPLTYRDYTGTPGGSMYGIQKSYRDPVMTSVQAKTKIPNLFLGGQSINIHGVLGVTIGSVITCGEMIGLESLMKKIRNAG